MVTTSEPPKAPALLMGIGLGGFVDGIVLHQILQWHHLLTDEGDFPMDTVAGLEDNTLADGLFHAATWVFVLIGSLAAVNAWRRGRLAPPWRSHVGMLLAVVSYRLALFCERADEADAPPAHAA